MIPAIEQYMAKEKWKVAAAGVMVVQRRRWIGMELMMGAEGPAARVAEYTPLR